MTKMFIHFEIKTILLLFSTECIYSPNAYRGYARAYIKDVEKVRASAIIDIIHSGEQLNIEEKVKSQLPSQGTCGKCGYISSQEICKACVMLEGTFTNTLVNK